MDSQGGDRREDQRPVDLAVHCTSPDRTVYTEPGNSEAWIATDYTVPCDD
ncbi:hypothetical protein [Halosegnis marinus]|uniref:Uncharacterized protein n=1 Tax=Halosegnis marinus TaxID=3034023 RepID=A0ABD5ZSW4_9EURY|nr:hypothetical protein [Halosegnis sp. DT85]